MHSGPQPDTRPGTGDWVAPGWMQNFKDPDYINQLTTQYRGLGYLSSKLMGDDFVNSWKEKAAQVQALGLDIETITAQSIITPSCGAGSLTPDLARKVLSLTQDVSARLRS